MDAQSRFQKSWSFLLLAVFLTAVAVRLPTFFSGFYNPDETCYATIGQRLLEGKILYLDIVDHKPPLIYYLYALFSFIGGGKAIIVAHAAITVSIAATGFVVAQIAKRIGLDEKCAWIAAILTVVCSSLGKPGDVAAANSELFFNLPLSLHIFFLVTALSADGHKRNIDLVISGLFAGVASLIKPHAGIVPGMMIIALFFQMKVALRVRFVEVFRLLLGLSFPIAAAVLFVGLQGALVDGWYWAFKVNSLYMQGHDSGVELFLRFIKQISYMMLAEQGGLWIPFAAWFIFFRKEGERLFGLTGRVAWVWLTASVLAIFPGYRFFGHYFLQLVPPLSIITSAIVVRVFDRITHKRIFAALWALLLIIPFLHSWIWSLPVDSFHKNIESEENSAIIDYLKMTAAPDDKIEVWGRFNGIPFLAGRKNATRFLNKNLVSGSFRGDALVPMPQPHWQMFMDDLAREKPEWFVDHSAVDMKSAPVSRFPLLSNYVAVHYKFYEKIGGDIIYRRR